MTVFTRVIQDFVDGSLKLSSLLVLLSVFGFVYLALTNKYGYGLNHVPGPWQAGYSNLYRLQRTLTGTSHTHDINMHRKYGSLVRLGPNMVSVGDPKLIPKIYGISSGFTKSHFYPVNFTYNRGNLVPGIFATTDESLHRKMKRPIAGLYSMTSVLAYEGLVDETISVMVKQLNERFANTKQPCVLSDWLQYYAFDVIGSVTFSSRIGFLERGTDIDNVMEGIWQRFKYFGTIGQMPWLDKFWDKSSIINAIFPAKSSPIAAFAMSLTRKRHQELTNKRTTTTHAGISRKMDFLSSFLDAQAKSKNEDIPDWYVTSWSISNMLAGSDTTAIYLRAIFYYLLRNPQSLRRVVDEIDKAQIENRLSATITYQESKALRYLDACIKESGRIHPAVGLPLERVVPRGGMDINGYHLPEGTIVGINAWTSQRDLDLFGPDADDWKPERWLESVHRNNEMERAMLLFGTGHRSCLGKNIALVEIYKSVPQLLREFDFKLVDPNGSWRTESFWVVRQTNMDVIIHPRNNCSKAAE